LSATTLYGCARSARQLALEILRTRAGDSKWRRSAREGALLVRSPIVRPSYKCDHSWDVRLFSEHLEQVATSCERDLSVAVPLASGRCLLGCQPPGKSLLELFQEQKHERSSTSGLKRRGMCLAASTAAESGDRSRRLGRWHSESERTSSCRDGLSFIWCRVRFRVGHFQAQRAPVNKQETAGIGTREDEQLNLDIG
jgi:hypothetical protein